MVSVDFVNGLLHLIVIGGGYAMPPVDGHPLFLFETMKRFQSTTGQPLLIAFLEYSKHLAVKEKRIPFTILTLNRPFRCRKVSSSAHPGDRCLETPTSKRV